ncbi:hypothetical protein N431DRAFT_34860 [Stipitochalara longipes BDJ]|nr:hypothetical protein N431DRAFT_34860 [Stipitochalara longipes BDJ]
MTSTSMPTSSLAYFPSSLQRYSELGILWLSDSQEFLGLCKLSPFRGWKWTAKYLQGARLTQGESLNVIVWSAYERSIQIALAKPAVFKSDSSPNGKEAKSEPYCSFHHSEVSRAAVALMIALRRKRMVRSLATWPFILNTPVSNETRPGKPLETHGENN